MVLVSDRSSFSSYTGTPIISYTQNPEFLLEAFHFYSIQELVNLFRLHCAQNNAAVDLKTIVLPLESGVEVTGEQLASEISIRQLINSRERLLSTVSSRIDIDEVFLSPSNSYASLVRIITLLHATLIN